MQRDFDFSTCSPQRNTIRELLETFRVNLCHRIDGHDTRVVEMMKYVHLIGIPSRGILSRSKARVAIWPPFHTIAFPALLENIRLVPFDVVQDRC